MQKDSNMESAISAIRNGETRGQQNRNLREKIAFTGAQAAMTGISGYLQGRESDQLQEENKNRAKMGNAIQSQTQERDRLLQAPDDYKSNDDGSTGPEWLRTGKVEHGKDWFPGEPKQDQGPVDLSLPGDHDPFVQDAAKRAREQQGSNVAAAGASIGGYRTVQGLDDADHQSDVLAADMSTGKNLMKAGKMMTGGDNELGGMMSTPPRRGY